MEPRFLLDTNICIYIRQEKPEAVLRRFRRLRPGEAAQTARTRERPALGERAVAVVSQDDGRALHRSEHDVEVSIGVDVGGDRR
jgi:predicted nucleic acid-binding protein